MCSTSLLVFQHMATHTLPIRYEQKLAFPESLHQEKEKTNTKSIGYMGKLYNRSVQARSVHIWSTSNSHVWEGSTHVALFERVESKAFCLINSFPLINCLQPLSLRRNVASIAIFYRYSHANCSNDLANCMPLFSPLASLQLPACLCISNFL